MRKNNYLFREKKYNNDTWEIHYLRINENLVRVTVDLYRSNRKWYQTKYSYEDWTYCGSEQTELLGAKAEELIDNYYFNLCNKKKLDNFFMNN